MKKNLVFIILLVFLVSVSCNQKTPVSQPSQNQFSVLLADSEKKGGVMTPKLCGNSADLALLLCLLMIHCLIYSNSDWSADRSKKNNIYKLASSGGESVQLTTDDGSSPQWISDGKWSSLLRRRLVDYEAWWIWSKSSYRIVWFWDNQCITFRRQDLFYKKSQTRQTANEKYNLPKAKVRIINDLMYRHWTIGMIIHTAIFSLPRLMGKV